jgi:GT2 family glycosyltransferase
MQPGALSNLIRFMDAHPRCGIAGPKLVHADGSLQPSCRNFPTPLTHFLEASGLWQLLRGNGWAGRRFYLCSPHDEVLAVDWLTGACLIVRAEAAQEAGYFDEALFPGLYGEDLEWCWRMKQHGWGVMFDPAATVTHLENQSPLSDRSVEMYSGFYRFCAHAYPRGKQQAIRLATTLALAPRRLLARNAASRDTYRRLMALPMPDNLPTHGKR